MTEHATRNRFVTGAREAVAEGPEAMAIPLAPGTEENVVAAAPPAEPAAVPPAPPAPAGEVIEPSPRSLGALALTDFAPPDTSVGERFVRFAYRLGPATSDGAHAIPQPGPDAPFMDCSLILVPLLAIDRSGHRLGQGGGHYDRVLPGLREKGALLIGLGWSLQRLDFALPSEPWDVALDGFASPSGLERFR